jgi:hypothetical protein
MKKILSIGILLGLFLQNPTKVYSCDVPQELKSKDFTFKEILSTIKTTPYNDILVFKSIQSKDYIYVMFTYKYNNKNFLYLFDVASQSGLWFNSCYKKIQHYKNGFVYLEEGDPQLKLLIVNPVSERLFEGTISDSFQIDDFNISGNNITAEGPNAKYTYTGSKDLLYTASNAKMDIDFITTYIVEGNNPIGWNYAHGCPVGPVVRLQKTN